ncbi:BRCT domain-containing protein [Polaribacter sp. Hel1_85]|uniref:BRCT domain-containing protein n=1 Tax=Polaribacter sp. Hel1_85 TaxID=1250005 RepID=UPI00052D4745|nr:BRCT domain-containing protein [Polaribacter sp. Hel1_85]KGL64155.1 hypothetical protein PHEL85_1207 [Polaribacter sp. Hel1_85]
MFSWFKKKEKIENPIEISVTGINPQTENEFLFYNFVEMTFAPHLQKWHEKAKSNGIKFKPQYEKAIKQKTETSKFKNPHSFPKYFNNKFDYIGFQFLSGTEDILSAFQIGTHFIINDKIVYSTKYDFRVPKYISNQKEFQENLDILEIDNEFLNDFSFEDVWDSLDLKISFNNNLLVCWNNEIEILEKILIENKIDDYNIKYIKIREIAKDNNLPDLIDSLLEHFESELTLKNDLSIICPTLALEFEDIGIILSKYIHSLNSNKKIASKPIQNKTKKDKPYLTLTSIEVKNENFDIIKKYSISKTQLKQLDINKKGFIFTGDITTERDTAKGFIEQNGGIIKSGMSSKLDYIVIGADFGWSKIQKVKEFNENKNCKIRILTNSDFEYLKKKYVTQHRI